jgi:DNA polymerase-1
MPYNTVLLKKLLRGKKADDIPAYPKFTPTMYNKLVTQMEEDGVDLARVFRYGAPTSKIINKYTGEEIPADKVNELPRDLLMEQFSRPAQLDLILATLGKYLDEDKLRHVEFIYNGINLNGAFTDLPVDFRRRPARITLDIKGYDEITLQKSVDVLKINLPAMDV